MLKNILVVGGVLAVAGVAYAGIRKFKKDSPKDLNKAAMDAVNTAVENTKKDLEAMSQVGSPLSQLFSLAHVAAKQIDFDPSWKNGTGYFNGATKVEVEVGKTAATVGDCGRRILLIGTEHGSIVLFERYTAGHGPFVVVHNEPFEMRHEIPSGNLTVAQLTQILGKYMK